MADHAKQHFQTYMDQLDEIVYIWVPIFFLESNWQLIIIIRYDSLVLSRRQAVACSMANCFKLISP